MGVYNLRCERAFLTGEYRDYAVRCIAIEYGMLSRAATVATGKNVLDGGCTLAPRDKYECPCVAAMRPYVKLFLTTCYYYCGTVNRIKAI